jgi:anti-sigma regulatory factor (Ser/Thr protein kinase)
MAQAECRFAGEASQVRAARQFVAGVLGGHWPDADDAVLLTSELASNAVLHSMSGKRGGKFTVRVAVKSRDYFWLEVEDEGGPWIVNAADSEQGRGLDIVDTLTNDWGREGGPQTGWIVWARIDWPRT